MNKQILYITCMILSLLALGCRKQQQQLDDCVNRCALVPEPGPCNAFIPKYYYDPVEKKCKQFSWGCRGIVPFETLQECEDCGCK